MYTVHESEHLHGKSPVKHPVIAEFCFIIQSIPGVRLDEDPALTLVHVNDIPEDLLTHIQIAQRLSQKKDASSVTVIEKGLKTIHVPYKGTDKDLPRISCKRIFQLLSAYFLVFIKIIIYDTLVIFFHVDAVLAVSVTDKDEIQLHAHEFLECKVSSVVVKRGNAVTQCIQSVFHCMISYPLPVKIQAYGICIAEYIYIIISAEIHGNIRLFELCELLRKEDPVIHILQDVPRILPVSCKFREECIPLFIELDDLCEHSALLGSCLEVLEIIGHPAEHQSSFPALLRRLIQFLEHCHEYMIVSVTYIYTVHPYSWGRPEIRPGARPLF